MERTAYGPWTLSLECSRLLFSFVLQTEIENTTHRCFVIAKSASREEPFVSSFCKI